MLRSDFLRADNCHCTKLPIEYMLLESMTILPTSGQSDSKSERLNDLTADEQTSGSLSLLRGNLQMGVNCVIKQLQNKQA